jgi:hypothetical protein
MGIAPDGRNVNNSVAGTIANNMVSKVFPDLFYKDSKGNIVVSQEGFNTAERMLPMTQTILPQVKIGVRFKKKTTQSNIQRPRSGDKDTYYVGTAKFDWITSEVVDHFRVGPNIEGEFCIEDSIGRFIPFALEDIDALIDVLLTYRQENDKDVEILNLQARVRELEDDED